MMAGKGKKSFTVHSNLNVLITALFFFDISLAKWHPCVLQSCTLRIIHDWECIEHILAHAINNENNLHEKFKHFDTVITGKWNLVQALPQQNWLKEAPLQKAVRKTLLETRSSLKSTHCSLEMGLSPGFSAASLTRIAKVAAYQKKVSSCLWQTYQHCSVSQALRLLEATPPW